MSRVVATGAAPHGHPPAPAGARRVLLACTRDEHHTLGLEALYTALVEREIDARLLGPSVDDHVLRDATATVVPAVVVVWAQVPVTAVSPSWPPGGRGPRRWSPPGPGWAGASLDSYVTWATSLEDAIAAAVSA